MQSRRVWNLAATLFIKNLNLVTACRHRSIRATGGQPSDTRMWMWLHCQPTPPPTSLFNHVLCHRGCQRSRWISRISWLGLRLVEKLSLSSVIQKLKMNLNFRGTRSMQREQHCTLGSLHQSGRSIASQLTTTPIPIEIMLNGWDLKQFEWCVRLTRRRRRVNEMPVGDWASA